MEGENIPCCKFVRVKENSVLVLFCRVEGKRAHGGAGRTTIATSDESSPRSHNGIKHEPIQPNLDHARSAYSPELTKLDQDENGNSSVS